MENDQISVREAARSGVRKGLKGFAWILKIFIPVSFLTMFLNWSGWISKADILLDPLMGWLHLPAMAGLPLLIGMIAGMYGGIASLMALPFTQDQTTLISVFMIVAHNLIQEGIVQAKSGFPFWKATLLRVGTASLCVLLVSPFLHSLSTSVTSVQSLAPVITPLGPVLAAWGMSMLRLILIVFLVSVTILVSLEIMKSRGWISLLIKGASPLFRLLGLPEKVGVLWVIGAVFGLGYGGAVIVEEIKEGHLGREDLEQLHISLGIQHSVIEDPALFIALGVHAFWLFAPRLVVALLVVRLYGLCQWLLRKYIPKRSS
jgi:hypothetical protein